MTPCKPPSTTTTLQPYTERHQPPSNRQPPRNTCIYEPRPQPASSPLPPSRVLPPPLMPASPLLPASPLRPASLPRPGAGGWAWLGGWAGAVHRPAWPGPHIINRAAPLCLAPASAHAPQHQSNQASSGHICFSCAALVSAAAAAGQELAAPRVWAEPVGCNRGAVCLIPCLFPRGF
jgi:hypothetical protein